ncbi:MAG: hypothetical protein MUC43_17275 [Pirellula sp.]|nr:hypothetical protein [Pirellula sp.]
MMRGLSKFFGLVVAVVFVGISLADEPKKESPEQRRERLRIAVKPDAKYLDKIRANFAKAQGHCLVMTDNEVSEKSKHGIVEGHAVFVCCPPCIKKMAAAPEKFLAKLDDLYEASLKK